MKTLMDVLKNDSTYKRLADWEIEVIRRDAYRLDIAELELTTARKKLERLEAKMTKMLMAAGKEYKVVPIQRGSTFMRPRR